jgi:hypothetical protein
MARRKPPDGRVRPALAGVILAAVLVTSVALAFERAGEAA